MMSSEEDTDYCGLYGDKLLLKTNNHNSNSNGSNSSGCGKQQPSSNNHYLGFSNCNGSNNNNSKRTRQRVDAGEPRNSYSSIPNFTSRPTFMNGGLYGAIFSQTQQHFSLFGGAGVNGGSGSSGGGLVNSGNNNSNGGIGGGANLNGGGNNGSANNSANNYGPVKMLNELLGRQVKQAQDATGPDNNSLILTSSHTPTANNLDGILSANNSDCNNLANLTKTPPFGELNSESCSPNPLTNSGKSANINASSGTPIVNGNNSVNSNQICNSRNNANNCDLSDNNSNNISDENNDLLISSTSQSPQLNCSNANDLAHHMLRNILQQSKKDLLAFDQEIQRVAQQQLSGSNKSGNTSDLCTMISDTKLSSKSAPLIKLEHGGIVSNENLKNNGNLIGASELMSDNSEMNCKNSQSKKMGKGDLVMSDSGENMDSDAIMRNGHHGKSHQQHDRNNNENNSNMNIDSENDDNSIHSTIQEHLMLRTKDGEDMESVLERSSNNNNSMDKLEQRRNSNVSPVISSSSSSAGNNNSSGLVKAEPVALDMKRARVENIVSTMRSSPALPLQQQNQQQTIQAQPVNGCKKRKLYQPQQHDNSAAERYAAAAAVGLNLGLNLQNLLLANNHLQQSFLANAQLNDLDDDLDDDNTGRIGDVDMADLDDIHNAGTLDLPQIHQKRVEKNALKSQLRSMQEQLAEMQQKYVQLCTRMEQESETTNTIQEIDDNSDTEMLNDANLDNNVQEIEDLDDDNDDVEDVEPNNVNDDVAMDSEVAVISTTTTPLLTTTTTLSSNRMMRNITSTPPDSNNNNIGSSNKQQSSPTSRMTPTNPKSIDKFSINKMLPNQAQASKLPHPGMHQSAVQAAAVAAAALHSHLPLSGNFGPNPGNNNPLLQHLQHGQGNSKGSAAAAAAAAHELLQQQNSSSHHQQHALSSALSNAMYLGVSQKLFLEQEARNLIAKEEEQREMIMMRDRDREREREQQRERMQQQSNQQMGPSQNHSPGAAPNHHLKPPGNKIQDRLNMMRSGGPHMMMGPMMSGSELEGLADMLKSEITASLSHLVDTIVTRFLHQKRFLGKQSEAAAAAAEQLSKDLLMASQLLDRKSPRTKIADRPIGPNQSASMFQTPKPPTSSSQQQQANHNKVAALNQVAAAALYNSMNQFCLPPPPLPVQSQSSNPNGNGGPQHLEQSHHHSSSGNPEQTEALPLVVAPKKKRHKVTDTRITPRTVSRILAQDGIMPPQSVSGPSLSSQSPLSLSSQLMKHDDINNNNNSNNGNNVGSMPITSSQMTSPVSSSASTTLTSPHHPTSSMMGNTGSHNHNGPSLNNGHKGMNYSSSGNNNASSVNERPSISPMTSPQSRQPQIPGGNPTTPSMHYAQQYHPSMPSLPPNQQSMMPVSLPTSVAIPNPSLPEESEVFSPYSPLFSRHGHGDGLGGAGGPGMLNGGGGGLPYGLQPSQFNHHHHPHIKMSSSPPGLGGMIKTRDSPPLPLHHSTMLHPALLAAAHHGSSPDYASHMRHSSMDSNNNTNDRGSDCNDPYDGIQPTSSTLTPMHLRKAKLMFFWVRYPSSAVLKMYFPDIRFNKNNTAQLVKWFSNFREFYYIQMEKYARQAVTEGVKNVDEIHVNGESEIYRVLNLHYNRNNHIEVPVNFRYVVEQTLREFYKSIQGGKDTEQSWKKSIYKIISRLDDPVPEYFKSPNFLEQLE